MAKKLITLLLSITIIACSSISIYATDTNNTGNTDTNAATEENSGAAVSEAADVSKAAVSKASTTSSTNTKYKKGLAAYIRYINPNVSKTKSLTMAASFIAKGDKYDLDPKVLMAIAKNESTFYTNATSPAGYKGLMQTSKALANKYGYKSSSLYKASVSIEVGARYLRAMKNRFKTYTKSLSAYAYGSGAVSSGHYSTKIANRMLNTRKQITNYLKNHNYI